MNNYITMNSVILKTLEIFLSVNTGLFKTKCRNTTHSPAVVFVDKNK